MIVVVDDDEDIREALVDMLTEQGFRTHGACDGLDAMHKLEHLNPDLVVLDYRMPRMSGSEFVRAMKAQGRVVPIVLVSAAREVAQLAATLGIKHFLRKPFDFDELLASIEAALVR